MSTDTIQRADPNQYVRPDAGGILLQHGLIEEAWPFVEKAFREMPENPRAIGNYAIGLTQLGKFQEALSYYELATKVAPDSALIPYNHACTLEQLGKFDAAFEKYKEAFTLDPTHKGIMHGYAVALLRRGEFTEAWPYWDETITKIRIPGLPNWHGPVTEEVAGKRFLIIHEGGYGDMFMFWRGLKLLKEAGAHVTYYGLANLQTLLAEHPYVDRWLQTPDPIQIDEFDYQTGGMRVVLEPFTPEMPILYAENTHDLCVDHVNVGVCWDSGEAHAQGIKIRALPLEVLEPLADSGANLISLQYGAEAPNWMHDTRDFLSDWKSTAEVIAGLDLVISVDTAVAHLAGSLGVPTWTLLPLRSDWRWFDKPSTDWYPTMKLYRNQHPRNWTDLVEKVATDLNAYC